MRNLRTTVIIVLFLAMPAGMAFGQNTWQLLYEQSSPSVTEAITFSDVYFKDANTGWASAANGMMNAAVFGTTDGGTTWNIVYNTTGMFDSFGDFEYVDENTFWAVGSKGMGKKCLMYKTTDGGANWTAVTLPDDIAVNSIHFADANTGWAVANLSYNGRVYNTTDGGTTWTTQFGGSTTDGWTMDELFCSSLVDANTMYIAANSGEMMKTTDGGTSWYHIETPLTNQLFGIFFLDANTGWVVAGAGHIIYTTDGGANWSHVTTDETVDFRGVFFTDTSNGWAVGGRADAGAIFSTTDGGATWVKDTISSVADLKNVFFTGGKGWAVGKNGTVHGYGTGTTGIDPVSTNTVPNQFKLGQNYPNPFNPDTRFSVKLAKPGFVTVAIYDILGRKVRTLVNELKEAGEYRVYWDAKNDAGNSVAGGMYIYKIATPEFSKSLKMVLLK